MLHYCVISGVLHMVQDIYTLGLLSHLTPILRLHDDIVNDIVNVICFQLSIKPVFNDLCNAESNMAS